MDLILGILVIILVLILFGKDIIIKDKEGNKDTINVSKKVEEIIIKIRDSLK